MVKNILVVASSLLAGIIVSVVVCIYIPNPLFQHALPTIRQITNRKEVIGFLPYWLLSKANPDYSHYITTLSYFALRIDKDGSIVHLGSPTQAEPGWYALQTGKVSPFLKQAKMHHVTSSLVIDSGDISTINAFVSNPVRSAKHLVAQVQPIMNTYGFTDLNLDIEYTAQASKEAQTNFTTFVKKVRSTLPSTTSLTLEISPVDTISPHLIDLKSVANYATSLVLMAYDYHATDSLVTGPIAPVSGAGIVSEFDVATAVDKALQVIPTQKLIVGIPLYGYEWETIGTVPRSAIIPGSGVLASNKRVESLLAACATCSAKIDEDAQESYFSYLSTDSNTNHLIFFPDKKSTLAKIALVSSRQLGGLALWSLGYEGNTILTPLQAFKDGF